MKKMVAAMQYYLAFVKAMEKTKDNENKAKAEEESLQSELIAENGIVPDKGGSEVKCTEEEIKKTLTLSDEELNNLREACVSDSTRVIHYLDSVLKDKQDLMERQVKSLEHIAEQAYSQASSARTLSEIARKHSNTAAHQVNILEERLKIQKEQLEFAKSEAASAKKDALFAKITSIITLIISVLMPLISG